MKAVHTFAVIAVFTLNTHAESAPNVLFIAIDDMNDWTGFLGGHPEAKTPNIDALAERGANFTNAHCVAPACSPSRNALLFGVEPFHSGLYPFYDLAEIPRSVLVPYTSLPRLFKENGYQTFGAGKIHHGSKAPPDEWSDYHTHETVDLEYDADAGFQLSGSKSWAFCPTKSPLQDHPDYQVASYGVDVLSRSHKKPFFLAVGISKPHLPFVCPKRFFDLYPDPIQAPSIKTDDLSDISWAGRAMVKAGNDLRFRRNDSWDEVRRAYLACISWADFNVGRVLDTLAESEYADNTIIVLWSDHGYHHGEKRSFRKFSLWEEATRVPFIIFDPREETSMQPGERKQAVSLINVYRTLAELAGIAPPAYVDGASLVPQLKDPLRKTDSPAITTWGRGNYSIRADDWRYIRYFDGSEELYSHLDDPNEWNNLADLPERADKKQQLIAYLPTEEAPLVTEGIASWNTVDADQPDLEKTKAKWESINATIKRINKTIESAKNSVEPSIVRKPDRTENR